MKKSIPIIHILLSAILWGSIGLFYNRLISVGFSPIQVVYLRITTAMIGFASYIAIRNPSWFIIRLKDIWMFVGTGMISLAGFNFCYFKAIDYLSVSVAACLLYTAPIFVVLMSAVLFRDSLTVRKVVAVFVTFIGCILVTEAYANVEISLTGVLFGIASGVGYALYSIFGTYALKQYSSETISFYTFLFAVIGVSPFCNIPTISQPFISMPGSAILNTLCIGIGVCLLPYFFYTKGMQALSASKASIVATLEPVVACGIGYFMYNEPFSIAKFFGILCIIGSIVVLQIPKTSLRRKKKKP